MLVIKSQAAELSRKIQAMTKHMTNRDLHSLLLVETMVYYPEDDDCCNYVFKKQSRQETKMYGRMPPDVVSLTQLSRLQTQSTMVKAIMIKQVQRLGRRIEELEAALEKYMDADELETFRETMHTARIIEVTLNDLADEVRVDNSLSMVKKAVQYSIGGVRVR